MWHDNELSYIPRVAMAILMVKPYGNDIRIINTTGKYL